MTTCKVGVYLSPSTWAAAAAPPSKCEAFAYVTNMVQTAPAESSAPEDPSTGQSHDRAIGLAAEKSRERPACRSAAACRRRWRLGQSGTSYCHRAQGAVPGSTNAVLLPAEAASACHPNESSEVNGCRCITLLGLCNWLPQQACLPKNCHHCIKNLTRVTYPAACLLQHGVCMSGAALTSPRWNVCCAGGLSASPSV